MYKGGMMLETILKNFKSKKMDLYKSEIRLRNYRSFCGLSLLGLTISAMVFVFGLILSEVVTFNVEFFIILGYFFILYIISKFYLKKHSQHITLVFYLALTPVMIMGILMGTFLDKTEPSITIMVFICVLPLFILDKPWRIILYITGTAIIYGICCFIAKDINMFMADLVDLVTFYFLSVGVNFFILNDRIESVENYIKYRNKSEIDLLTGIYNRGTGVEMIEQLMDKKKYGAFILIDIDDFKYINDSYGHIVGDRYLQAVADNIKNIFYDSVVLRLGGDEFAIYSKDLNNEEKCKRHFEKLFDVLNNMEDLSQNDYAFHISLGCSICDKSITSFEDLYSKADEALYAAKEAGKGCYRIN